MGEYDEGVVKRINSYVREKPTQAKCENVFSSLNAIFSLTLHASVDERKNLAEFFLEQNILGMLGARCSSL